MTPNQIDFSQVENQLMAHVQRVATVDDPAHDLLHFRRVVRTAKEICLRESGRLEIVLPAACLHDIVVIPKNDPRRSIASRLSADEAIRILKELEYPSEYFEEIRHAIEAHSFSANIPTETIEAKIVQDSDRLDGLGAIGVARCFATAGLMRRAFYSDVDPFCSERIPDDQQYTIDHFYKKLFHTAETLKTKTGREIGNHRVEVMRQYLSALKLELG